MRTLIACLIIPPKHDRKWIVDFVFSDYSIEREFFYDRAVMHERIKNKRKEKSEMDPHWQSPGARNTRALGYSPSHTRTSSD